MAEDVLTIDLMTTESWKQLAAALDDLPKCLADLRSPLPIRMKQLGDVLRDAEAHSLELVTYLVSLRNQLYPDPSAWAAVPLRYPQPDPTLVLALREWVMSLGTEPSVPLQRQKRLNKALTQILVARAALHTYSEQLHEDRPDVLVRVLSAIWVLIAEIWKARPLLSSGSTGQDG